MDINTERLILRTWRESDAEAMFKYASDLNVRPRAGWPPHKSVEESLAVIRDIFSNDHTWAIVLKETGEAIGCMGYYLYGESNIPIGRMMPKSDTGSQSHTGTGGSAPKPCAQ